MTDAVQEPSFDDAALARLREDVGEEVTSSLIRQYRTDAGRRVQEIRDAVESGDLERASEAGHSLKSTSAMVGLMALSSLCQRMEHASDLEHARSLLPRIEAAHREALALLASTGGG
ncbi:MAG: Hpt domain-containing protein [Myxococcota bacterium]